MKKLFFLFFVLPLVAVAGEVTVSGVTARQRYPWNGLVDITVTLQGESNLVAWAEYEFVATNNATKAAVPVVHVTRNGAISGGGTIWTQKFIWDAKTDVGAVKIDDVTLTVDASFGVQLWEDGPYWAGRNVGATKPEECGYYFWWGDTVGYTNSASGWNAVDGSKAGFSFSSVNCPTCDKSNSDLLSVGYIDSTGNLVAAHDAATVHLGGPWRMPTDAEFSALINNCDTEWTSRNGVFGRLVKGRGTYATKSIFLPAAGDGLSSGLNDGLGSCGAYWSSTTYSGYSGSAWYLYFYLRTFGSIHTYRYYGRSVRAVRGFAR